MPRCQSRNEKTRPKACPAAVIAAAVIVATICGALAVGAPAAAQRRVEVYKARHRTADELLPLAETALSGHGEVALDPGTNSLVLIGERGAVSETLRLLSAQDRRLRTVVLRHGTRRLRELSTQGFTVRFDAQAGAYRIGRLAYHPRDHAAVGLRAESALERLSQSLSARIRTTEGGRTRIETGTSVPYTTAGAFGSNTQFVDATTGFEARTRIRGDGRVEVDLASFARELLPGAAIDTRTSRTVVALEPGVVVAVAGTDSTRDEQRITTGIDAARARSNEETVVLLRVDVE